MIKEINPNSPKLLYNIRQLLNCAFSSQCVYISHSFTTTCTWFCLKQTSNVDICCRLGLAYAGSNREDVLSLLLPVMGDSKSNMEVWTHRVILIGSFRRERILKRLELMVF